MTYKEFKREVFSIYTQSFAGDDKNPIEYGIQRAEFEENKLCRLIALADQTAFSTAKRKGAGWRRQLERVQQIKARLELRRKEAPVRFAFGDDYAASSPLSTASTRTIRPTTAAG